MALNPKLPWKLYFIADSAPTVRHLVSENSTEAYSRRAVTEHGPTHPAVIAAGGRGRYEMVVDVTPAAAPAPSAPAPQPPAPAPSPTTPPPPAPSPAPAGTWVTGPSLAAEPTTPRPAKGVVVTDPTFGTQIARVSSRSEPPSGWARNDYSRRQAFNADNTRQLVAARDGWWHTYNAKTFAYEKKLQGLAGDAEPQWNPKNPDLLWYIPTNGIGMRIHELNVATNTTRLVLDMSTKIRAIFPRAAVAWTGAEGSPSADGRFWCFKVETAAWEILGIVVVDLQQGEIVGSMPVTNNDRPDHVSMSPSGRWAVVSFLSATIAYSRDFKTKRQLLASSQHSDLCVGPTGNDVYVAVDYAANDGAVFMFDIDANVRTDLFASYIGGNFSAFHFSGKCFDKPGWVLVSAQYDDPAKPRGWPWRKIFLQELKKGGRVLNVAWHRTGRPASDYYFFSPVASISRDGSRVAFNSSWGSSSEGDIDVYQARIPAIPA